MPPTPPPLIDIYWTIGRESFVYAAYVPRHCDGKQDRLRDLFPWSRWNWIQEFRRVISALECLGLALHHRTVYSIDYRVVEFNFDLVCNDPLKIISPPSGTAFFCDFPLLLAPNSSNSPAFIPSTRHVSPQLQLNDALRCVLSHLKYTQECGQVARKSSQTRWIIRHCVAGNHATHGPK